MASKDDEDVSESLHEEDAMLAVSSPQSLNGRPKINKLPISNPSPTKFGLSPLAFGSYYHGSGSSWNPYTAEELAPDSDQRSTSSSGSSSESSDGEDAGRKKKPRKEKKKKPPRKKKEMKPIPEVTGTGDSTSAQSTLTNGDRKEKKKKKKQQENEAEEKRQFEIAKKAMEEEEKRLQQMEANMQAEEEKRRKELEAKLEAEEEERRLALERKIKEEEEARRKELILKAQEEEQQRELERQRVEEEEKRMLLERKKAREKIRQEEIERKQAEEEERRLELERKKAKEKEEKLEMERRKAAEKEEEARLELERQKTEKEEQQRLWQLEQERAAEEQRKKAKKDEELKKHKKDKDKKKKPGQDEKKKSKHKKSHRHDDSSSASTPLAAEGDDKHSKKKKKGKEKNGVGVVQRLLKARQKMTEGNKKTREELKREFELKKIPVTRPPPDVYQKSMEVQKNYEAPVYPKSKEEERVIQGALSQILPLKKMPPRNVNKLIAAFERKSFDAGSEIDTRSDDGEDDLFYVVNEGTVGVEVDGKEVREAKKGDTVGDSNLYHSIARSESYIAKGNSELFRVDQSTYRSIVQNEIHRTEDDKRELVDKAKLFEHMSVPNKKKLAAAMKPVSYEAGETVEQAAVPSENFYMVASGRMICRDPEGKMADYTVERGGCIGEQVLVPGSMPNPIDVFAEGESTAYRVDRSTFETVIGKRKNVVLAPEEVFRLQSIDILRYKPHVKLMVEQMSKLVSRIQDRTYEEGETIIEGGVVEVPAAIYFVRQGTVKIKTGRFNKVKMAGNHFGEEIFESAKAKSSTMGLANDTIVAGKDCVLGVLTMESYLAVNEPKPGKKSDTDPLHESVSESNTSVTFDTSDVIPQPTEMLPPISHKYELGNLVKKVLLGEGQFGQVWMVTDETEKEQCPYALKVQSKWELVEQAQAEICIREKEIMFNLKHPMIINLCASFQDKDFVYLLLEMVNGGELFSLIHPIDGSGDGLPENQSKFYAFVLSDILKYMHKKKYVYRDLKPENVLISSTGYPVLIDFGFTKKLDDSKTFTLCGTPGYLSPEMVLSEGHTFSADHWALGILTYEMLSKQNPFFYDGMDSTMLYKSIAEDDYDELTNCSEEARDFIDGLLTKDPVYRLGSLARGENEILRHPWFKGMDPTLVRKQQLKAPWIPEVTDPFDVRHFEDWGHLADKTTERYPELTEKQELIFDDFDD